MFSKQRTITRQQHERKSRQEHRNQLHVIPDEEPAPAPYNFRHRRHQIPTVTRARYANAAVHLDHYTANSVLHPITGVPQEY